MYPSMVAIEIILFFANRMQTAIIGIDLMCRSRGRGERPVISETSLYMERRVFHSLTYANIKDTVLKVDNACW